MLIVSKLLQYWYVFRTHYRLPEDRLYGSMKDNKWNGMMKMIIEDDVEFGIGGFTFNPERMTAVHYLVPTSKVK